LKFSFRQKEVSVILATVKSSPLKELRGRLEALEREVRLQESILEAIQEPFFLLDRQGRFQRALPQGMELLGYSWEELQEMVFADLLSPEDRARIGETFQEMEEGNETRFRTHIASRPGESIPVEFIGSCRGEFFGVTLKDLRERIQVEEELERTKKEFTERIRERDYYARELLAMRDLYKKKAQEIEKMKEDAERLSITDDLTGIHNHRFFIQQLEDEVRRSKRYSNPLSLLMIDIDYFKHYNDSNGHLAGDQVLKAIGFLIRHGVRDSDSVARYGGEEFAAILINTGKEAAKEIAERVRRYVEETEFPNEGAQPHGGLTVSIGMATFSPAISTANDLIREADNALYRAKRAGRNRVEG
jgi:diguanylate cyclase (GGDEF)-like protein/PAS domain S-box-containing protein